MIAFSEGKNFIIWPVVYLNWLFFSCWNSAGLAIICLSILFNFSRWSVVTKDNKDEPEKIFGTIIKLSILTRLPGFRNFKPTFFLKIPLSCPLCLPHTCCDGTKLLIEPALRWSAHSYRALVELCAGLSNAWSSWLWNFLSFAGRRPSTKEMSSIKLSKPFLSCCSTH